VSYKAPQKAPVQQQIALKLEDSTGMSCDSCGCVFFTEALMLRRWSKLLTGTPDDYVQPVPCFRCSDCGTPLKQFFPKGMKDIEEALGLNEVKNEEPNKLLF
jgi:hypothetical protein